MRGRKIGLMEWMLVSCLAFSAFVMFMQNFLASADFDFLSIHSIDEVAFQASLRALHSSDSVKRLFTTADYGYGWIYWFPIAVLTYPAFLLQQSSGVDWPLIVIPRMLSLMFALGASYLMYKIVNIYIKNKAVVFTSVLLFPLFPTGAYFSVRFGTTCQVAFFCLLSVYLVIKNETLDRKKLRVALIAFAIALATKVSAAVLAPMLTLLILSRYGFNFSKNNLKVWLPEIAISILVFIVALSPRFTKEIPDSIVWGIRSTQSIHIDYLENFKNGIVQCNYSITVFTILSFGLIVCAIIRYFDRSDSKRFDFICFTLGCAIGVTYLCLTVGHGSVYVYNYSTAITFVLPVGLAALDCIHTRLHTLNIKCINMFYQPLIYLFCFFVIFCHADFVKQHIDNKTYCNPFFYFQEVTSRKSLIAQITELQETVEPYVNIYDKPSIIGDWTLPVFFSPLKHNIMFVTIWEDLHLKEWVNAQVIVLDKKSTGFLPNGQLLELIKKDRRGEQLLKDAESREFLLNTLTLYNKKWNLVEETKDYYIFVLAR